MQQVRLSDDMISFETTDLEGLGHEHLIERYQRLTRVLRGGDFDSSVVGVIRSNRDAVEDADIAVDADEV